MTAMAPPSCRCCGFDVSSGTSSKRAAFFRCLQGHVFSVCGPKCKDKMRKECEEVEEKLRDAFNNHEHKRLSKAGWDKRRVANNQSSSVWKMSSAARVQMKQLEKAQANGHTLCPQSDDGGDTRTQLVPLCAHVLEEVNTFDGKPQVKDLEGEDDDAAAEDDPVEAEHGGLQEGPFLNCANGVPLCEDVDLVLLKPGGSNEEEEEALARGTTTSRKKQQKSRKEKANMLQLQQPEESFLGTGDPLGRQGGLTAQLKEPTEEDVSQLSSILACTEARALELLHSTGGKLEVAIAAFFATDQQPAAAQRQAAAQLVAAAAKQQAQRQPVASGAARHLGAWSSGAPPAQAATSPTDRAGVAAVIPPSSPVAAETETQKQPAPPLLPDGWRAVWSQEEGDYYYWHVATRATQWDVPTPAVREEGTVDHVSVSSEATSITRSDGSTTAKAVSQGHTRQVADITGCTLEEARQLLAQHDGNLEAAIRAHVAKEKVAKVGQSTPSPSSGRNAPGNGQAQSGKDGAPIPANNVLPLGVRMCSQHWQGPSSGSVCLKLVRGAHVNVTWVDGQAGGWAYGSLVEEPGNCGYCPQEVLVPVPPRAMKPISVGERLRVNATFEPPRFVDGYLSARAGDEVIAVHPVEEPYIWAYVARANQHPPPGHGWLPMCILDDRGPCPAG
eukprot:TRINITY_DN69736_c0_g1_i2.p1 TRINITY_DN69736_c0_g1~~TRINITY_DN69736_c0_g1_i2.p1  ORF type:complete len:671 (-),score=152.49 TRINITY_DN69736_c0_g1_i2:124-2136(-)